MKKLVLLLLLTQSVWLMAQSLTVFNLDTTNYPKMKAKFYAFDGSPVNKPLNSTLRITSPNGGEFFVAGSDTLITWEGVPLTTIVRLTYSIDSGKTWILITYKASNNQYVWKNVPKTYSKKCLAKATIICDTSTYIEWEKSYGGTSLEGFDDIIQTSDGGYLMISDSYSNNMDLPGNKGSTDVFIVKLASTGEIVWKRNYGGSKMDFASSVIETSDQNFLIVGGTCSTNGDITNYYGGFDAWVVMLNPLGDIIWQKSLGGQLDDYALSVCETDDGNYVFAGSTESDADVMSDNYFNNAFWFVKFNPKGDIIWEKIYGGTSDENAYSINKTSDGGFIASGETWSSDGDLTNNYGNVDYWVVKLNAMGNLLWQKSFGGFMADISSSVIETKDGGYVVAGQTNSYDGTVELSHGSFNYWILKLDVYGRILWQKTFGGKGVDICKDINETSDGGFILNGWSTSRDGDVVGLKGGTDSWVLKLDFTGEIEWQRTLGGSEYEHGIKIKETNDGGYIVGNSSFSIDGDVTGNHGGSDCWVVKLMPLASSITDVSDSLWSIVYPELTSKDIDMKQCLTGKAKDSVITSFLVNTGNYPCRVDSIVISGTDAADFNILNGMPPLLVDSNSTSSVEFRFQPSSVGIKAADLLIFTQADTVFGKMTGEGIEPRLALVNSIIDFGQVDMGYAKDSIHAATIVNIGTAPITITQTKHNKPNDIDFTTLAGTAPFTLAPGDTAFMDLRFLPSATGRTNGTLEFHYNGFGSPQILLLFGEGLDTKPNILAEVTPIPDLICESSTFSEVKISNSGRSNLVIDDMYLTGADAGDFSISGTMPITNEPDSTVSLLLAFSPIVPGLKSAELNIKSNADNDTLMKIPITARKDSIGIIPEINAIDLGILCPGTAIDTVIIIKNHGTISAGAYITTTGNIITQGATNIEPGNIFPLEVKFTGLTKDGVINENITITDSICGYAYEVIITGEVIEPELVSDDLTITSITGSQKDGKLIIRNNSKLACTITGINNLLPVFSIIGNPFPINIAPFGTSEIDVRYIPDDKIQDSVAVQLSAIPCDIVIDATLIGIPASASALLTVGSAEAYPGDTVVIPLYLSNRNNLDIAGVTGLKADLSFNPTLLAPLNYMQNIIDNLHSTILLDSLTLNPGSSEPLASLKFIAGLGNSEECQLSVSNVSVLDGIADIAVSNGTFKLLGICPEGGSRLINPNATGGIISIKPNPAEDIIELEIELTEEGRTQIQICDLLGKTVLRIMDEFVISFGRRKISVDLGELPDGVYSISLNTPTIHHTLMFIRN